MRKALSGFSSILIIGILFCSQTGCEKETASEATTSKEAILVQKTWNVDFVYSLIGTDLAKYVRGGVNTTGISFDNQKYKFDSNGTGTYTNPSGTNYALSWAFTTTDKRTLRFDVPALNSFSTWEMVEMAGNYMQFSVSVAAVGNVPKNLSTYRLIQAP
ncbi:MAG TPA: hypothetical protein VF622_12835 [Segetibacter sp.]|jgi:hypothetical protein